MEKNCTESFNYTITEHFIEFFPYLRETWRDGGSENLEFLMYLHILDLYTAVLINLYKFY